MHGLTVKLMEITMNDAIFVFGSNLAGRHGKGAALWARRNRGAKYGQGIGLQGQCYAIPTKGYSLEILPIEKIKGYVDDFIYFAKHVKPIDMFQLTPIGCGLAGFKHSDIAPLFKDAPSNVIIPDEFKQFLEGKNNE